MPYIDGFGIPVPTAKREDFRPHEGKWWPEFRKMGAQTLVVGWGDDVPPSKRTDFFRSIEAKDDETVVFCWMTWPDRATRDAAYRKMEEQSETDPAMMPEAMPFDGKRMIYGGFETILMEGSAG